jgi:hypothetical protein
MSVAVRNDNLPADHLSGLRAVAEGILLKTGAIYYCDDCKSRLLRRGDCHLESKARAIGIIMVQRREIIAEYHALLDEIVAILDELPHQCSSCRLSADCG